MFAHFTVPVSAEFRRIDALPRRVWTDEQIEAAVEHYTSLFRKPKGTMRLKPLQAISLHEFRVNGGLLGALPCGKGKTLLSLLLPLLSKAKRPLLLLPAGLIDKTKADREELSRHWKIPHWLEVESYDKLSREGAATWLDTMAFDLIIADEAHRLANLDAGVTRRVDRYMSANPDTACAFLSGTLYKEDLREMAHLAAWALKERSPVPLDEIALDEWSQALTVQKNPMKQWHPGPLLNFATAEDTHASKTVQARFGFRRRLRETPGVVVPNEGPDDVRASLRLNGIVYPVARVTEDHFKLLREEWTTPDGWTFNEAIEAWRHARELSLGMHYAWDPRPPKEWLKKRQKWSKFLRDALGTRWDGGFLDTPKQVERMCEAYAAKGHAINEWREWKEIEPTFTVNQIMEWHDDSALAAIEKWCKGGPGVIWTEHAFFAREAARRLGLTYYGEKGYSDDGKYIDHAPRNKSALASTDANATGRNLQGIWSRALVTCPSANATQWEQRLSRLHREGQLDDEVVFDCLVGCFETHDSIRRAREGAKNVEQIMGAPQKILIADLTWPRESMIPGFGDSPRWRSQSGDEESWR